MTLNSGPHIVGLNRRIEELEAEVAELRSLLAIDESADWLMKAGFSPAEARMLSILLSRDVVSRDQLLYASCPSHRRFDLSPNQVSVQLNGINRKLAPLGVATATIRERGVYLPPEAKERLWGLKNGRSVDFRQPLRAAAE